MHNCADNCMINAKGNKTDKKVNFKAGAIIVTQFLCTDKKLPKVTINSIEYALALFPVPVLINISNHVTGSTLQGSKFW